MLLMDLLTALICSPHWALLLLLSVFVLLAGLSFALSSRNHLKMPLHKTITLLQNNDVIAYNCTGFAGEASTLCIHGKRWEICDNMDYKHEV